MRIAIDARPLLARQISGIPEYTGWLIDALTTAHPEVEWRLFYSGWRQRPDNWHWLGDKPNVSWYPLKYPNKLINATAWLLNRPFLDKYCPADAWFLPHFNFTPLTGRTPTVLTIHDLSFLRQPEFFSWRRRFWQASLHLQKLVKRADKIVAISENTKRDLMELLGVSEEKITVIYSAANPQFRPLAEDDQCLVNCRQKYDLPRRFILSPATCEPRKNLANIIRAYDSLRQRCSELKDCRLVIIGSQGWRQGEAKQAQKLAINHQDIRWLGYLPTEDLPALYNLASLIVYPSFYEGFGLPVLEAMASGRPVITSAVTALPEIAGTAALMVDPADANAMSRAMEQILIDRQLAAQLAQAGLEQAKQFSWEKTAEKYWKLLV
jgi:glycosyltransferase involved in cell wall biosynthesis